MEDPPEEQVPSSPREPSGFVHPGPATAARNTAVHLGEVMADLREVLFHPARASNLPARIASIAIDLRLLVAQDADLVLFEIQRYGKWDHGNYSVVHAAKCAIAGELVARRLKWREESRSSLVKAALTMNLPITALQGELASQPRSLPRLTDEQALEIAMHPTRCADMLREAGIRDPDWLLAVEEHHERADGSGYPRGTLRASPLAVALRTIDLFFAKISPRASRSAIPLRRAARQLYDDAENQPIVEALIREFGLYPPGTYVLLHNGDLGIVLRRGKHVHTPIAIALANGHGERLSRRIYRDTSDKRYAIVIASNMEQRPDH